MTKRTQCDSPLAYLLDNNDLVVIHYEGNTMSSPQQYFLFDPRRYLLNCCLNLSNGVVIPAPILRN